MNKKLNEAYYRRMQCMEFAGSLQGRTEITDVCPGQYWKIMDSTLILDLDVANLIEEGIADKTQIRVVDSPSKVRMLKSMWPEGHASTSLDILDGVPSIVHCRITNDKLTLTDVLARIYEPGTLVFADLPSSQEVGTDEWALFDLSLRYDGNKRVVHTLVRRHTGGKVAGINLPHGVQPRQYNAWLERRMKQVHADVCPSCAIGRGGYTPKDVAWTM